MAGKRSGAGRGRDRAALLIALAIGGAIAPACSSDKSSNGDSPALPDATAPGEAQTEDAAAGIDRAGDASSDGGLAGDADAAAACPDDVAKLHALLEMSACGVCTLAMCTSFANDCTASCKCTDALLSLLDCVTIGTNVQSCQTETLGALTPAQLNEFIECNGTCGTPCSDKTFFPDAGDDAGDTDAGDANDAGDATDATDATDAN